MFQLKWKKLSENSDSVRLNCCNIIHYGLSSYLINIVRSLTALARVFIYLQLYSVPLSLSCILLSKYFYFKKMVPLFCTLGIECSSLLSKYLTVMVILILNSIINHCIRKMVLSWDDRSTTGSTSLGRRRRCYQLITRPE